MRTSLPALLIVTALASQACVITVKKDELHFPDAVERVHLDVGAGDIEVLVADREHVLVERTQRYVRNEPNVRADLVDGVLYLDVDCEGFHTRCGADHVVHLPRSAAITALTGAGDVVISDIDHLVDIETGAGDVRSIAISGDLDVHTGAGDVSGEWLTAASVVVSTDAGDVYLGMDEPADLVLVDTRAGDVEIDTLAGAYRVTTDTDAGDVELRGVTPSSSSPHALDVSTGAGDILLRGI